jgi:tripartite-type tricarboxylate transporter receptor subunit TctC
VDDVPTFVELGIKGMEVSLWYGLVGPAKLPEPIVRRLNTELATILKTNEVLDSFAKQGALPTGGSPQDYAKFMQDESARWGDVVKRNGIKLE